MMDSRDKLANEGHIYFLSRPRRFGKSLLISILKYYFQGRKDLFQECGEAIADDLGSLLIPIVCKDLTFMTTRQTNRTFPALVAVPPLKMIKLLLICKNS